MTPNIPIIAWSPDADPTQPGVLADVENMVPTRRGYAADSSLALSPIYTVTASAEICGAQTVGTVFAPFYATASNLYAWRGSFQVASRTGTPYTAASIYNPWRFAGITQGSDVVTLAVQFENTLQATTNHISTNFADVAGAPKAQTIAVQRNFVLLGACTTGAGYFSDSWFCSAQEDYTDWTPDIATQCATGRLTATPGDIIRLIAFRDYVIAFKRGSFYRGTYVGPADNTWAWPVVSQSVGLVAHDAVCEAEGVLYWLGYDGFYRWAGGQVERLQNAPWEWLKGQAPFGSTFDVGTQAIWDAVQRVVRWTFKFAVNGTQRLCLTYHPDSGKWGRSVFPEISWMFTLPNVTIRRQPQNDYVFLQEAPAYFVKTGVASYVLSIPWATPGASTCTTGDIGDDDQSFALTRARARFLQAPTTSTAQHFYRMNSDDALTTGETVSRTDGKYDISHSARWHRLKFSQTGRYEVTGFSVDTPKAGKR